MNKKIRVLFLRSNASSTWYIEKQGKRAISKSYDVYDIIFKTFSTLGAGSYAIDFTQLGHRKCFGTK